LVIGPALSFQAPRKRAALYAASRANELQHLTGLHFTCISQRSIFTARYLHRERRFILEALPEDAKPIPLSKG
jgi:hypothetical protein